MTRIARSLLAATIAAAALAAPAVAQDRAPAGYYTVELAAPATEARAIAGGVVFRCADTTCTAPRSGDRPLRVCSDLRRAVGNVTSFTVAGEALAEDLLTRCNR